MLQDPENFEEWEIEIRAANIDAARNRCKAIADSHPLTEVVNVTQATTTPYNGTYRFICWFRSEGEDDGNDSNS